MVKDHTKDVADFQKEANNGQNDAIKNYAEQTVPVLQSHLDQARRMEQTVTQSASNRTRTTYPSNNTVPAANVNVSLFSFDPWPHRCRPFAIRAGTFFRVRNFLFRAYPSAVI